MRDSEPLNRVNHVTVHPTEFAADEFEVSSKTHEGPKRLLMTDATSATTTATTAAPSQRNGHVPLCGRSHECQLLRQAYQRSKQKNHDTQELVLIQGPSGTGKTTLAKSLISEVLKDDGGFFLSGKFEQYSFQNPYEVFVAAFTNFSEWMMILPQDEQETDDSERRHKMRQVIRDAVGTTEGKLLTYMIPALADCLLLGESQQSDDANSNDHSSSVHSKDALHRLTFAFSTFVRAISSVAPLVLFFDDLQWSDSSSLNLLQELLERQHRSDGQEDSSSLLVICAMRRGDEEPEDVSSKQERYFVDFLDHVSTSPCIHTTHISLSNLNEAATKELVSQYLYHPASPSKLSRTLGPIIFQKSCGNPFHAIQILGPLAQMVSETDMSSAVKSKPQFRRVSGNHQHNLSTQLSLSEAMDGADDILQLTEVAQTVDELLRDRFTLLPHSVKQVLQIAACMGDTIDHQALSIVLDGNNDAAMDVGAVLHIALTSGFLAADSMELCHYRFTHDRVRQAVLAMTDNVEATSFHIGYRLWTKSSPMLLANKIFLVANLLNHGTKLLTDPSERYKAAAMNLEAGSNAMSLSAFQDAARFLKAGIDFLQGTTGSRTDCWREKYELSLSVFSAAADAQLCCQNFDCVAFLVEQVLQNATSVKDKLRAYIVQVNSLGQLGNVEAATQLGIQVMRELGEPLPVKVTGATILIEIIMTRAALRGRSNEALLRLPPLQDENKMACMYVLSNLLPYAFQASSNYIAIIGARLVRLCVRYGMHKWCANGFSVFGFVLCMLNRQEGNRLGKLAMDILDTYGGRELLPRVHMNFYALNSHWTHPLKDSLKPLEVASKIGMEVGDVEYAMLALSTCATHSLYQGLPLRQVESLFDYTVQRMQVLREEGLVILAGMSRQFVHVLTGQIPLEKLFSGELSPLLDSSREVESQLVPYSYYFMVAEVAFLFGNVALAAQMLVQNRRLRFEPLGSYLYAKVRFIEALIYTSLACNSVHGRKGYINIARGNLKQLKAWSKDCPQNFLHKQYLVEAELASLGIRSRSKGSKSRQHIQELYDQAAAGSLKEGYVHEAALANELAGNFMNRQNEVIAARKYWDEACNLYLQWDATEKVKHLSEMTRLATHNSAIFQPV